MVRFERERSAFGNTLPHAQPKPMREAEHLQGFLTCCRPWAEGFAVFARSCLCAIWNSLVTLSEVSLVRRKRMICEKL